MDSISTLPVALACSYGSHHCVVKLTVADHSPVRSLDLETCLVNQTMTQQHVVNLLQTLVVYHGQGDGLPLLLVIRQHLDLVIVMTLELLDDRVGVIAFEVVGQHRDVMLDASLQIAALMRGPNEAAGVMAMMTDL